MARVFNWIAVGIAVLLMLIGGTIVVAALIYNAKSAERTPAGFPQDAALYVTMSDGTRIAADVALPANLKPDEKIPALIVGTPYWRAVGLTFLGKAVAELGLLQFGTPDIPMLNRRGYAVLGVDTRGTGASFGHQSILLDQREIDDFGEIVDWITRRPWSNGRVGAYGFSYRGMLAVKLASLGRPQLKAIAPSFDPTDLYLVTYPGGVFSDRFLKTWGAQTALLNKGIVPDCGFVCSLLVSGPKSVDADKDGSLLSAAIAEHARNYDVYACARRAPFRDSEICTSGKSISDVSEFARKAEIEKAGVPFYVTAGYFDDGIPGEILRRFSTFSNPQIVVLGPISHGGFKSTDPFSSATAVDPSYAEQVADMADFFDRTLKGKVRPISKQIRYEVLNGGGWKTSSVWPPAGAHDVELYLAPGHALAEMAPTEAGVDQYKVDFSASTGFLSRHQSPVDLSRTTYPDRAQEDRKLLVYDGAPLRGDLEIAGGPLMKLTVATTATDGEVIVYIEDVTHDGRVIYLSEGVLRLVDRKPAPAGVGADSGDPLHTYLARDAEPVIPKRAEEIALSLSPIAVVFRKGDRIRIAIAGADAANLARIPAEGDAILSLSRGGASASSITLPVVSGTP